MKANVFNLQRYCLHDGPGIRTTVFLKGCPLRCVWCHNPESQAGDCHLMYYESKCTGCGACLGLCPARTRDPENPGHILVDRKSCVRCGKCIAACPHHANEFCGEERDTEELFAEVLKDQVFYRETGGLTVSGGEPAAQPEATLDLLRRARESGISAVLETSGYGDPTFFDRAAELGAIFYYDLKCMDPEKHRSLIGVSNEKILSNLARLMRRGAQIVLRLPLVPGLNDSDADLDLLARYLAEHAGQYDHAEIMKYHNLGMSKARAMGRAYHAPAENAEPEQVDRWIGALGAYGAGKIEIS